MSNLTIQTKSLALHIWVYRVVGVLVGFADRAEVRVLDRELRHYVGRQRL